MAFHPKYYKKSFYSDHMTNHMTVETREEYLVYIDRMLYSNNFRYYIIQYTISMFGICDYNYIIANFHTRSIIDIKYHYRKLRMIHNKPNIIKLHQEPIKKPLIHDDLR